MQRLPLTLFAAAFLVIAPPTATADITAIVGARVVVGDGTVHDRATVIIDGDTIAAVGDSVAVPGGANIVDGTGLVVWPGMIDPFTTLGLVEVSADAATNDANEATKTSTAHLRASDGFDPYSEPIAVTRIGGITTALVSPGTRNPINGQAAIVSLAGDNTEEMLVFDGAALVFNLAAQRQDKYPSTRPATVAFIRQRLYDARAYERRRGRAAGDCDPETEWWCHRKTDLEDEALLLALRREVPVIAVAPRVQDIANALALAEEFDLRLILYDAGEVWKMLDEVVASGVPVLLENTFDAPSERDPYDRYFRLAHTLWQAGVPFAFTTGGSHDVRQLPEHAAMAVTFGLPESEAVKAVTLNAAQILGIEGSHGTIEPGKKADVVVWDGNPLQITSRVQRLFIRGREIPLRSRQEMLRDRYQRAPASSPGS
jgi:imidazolonepropionase-like amidohydrolase